MKPSRELSDAVMLAVAFAEHGFLPESPARMVTPGRRRLTRDDFARFDPRVLSGMVELFALVDAGGGS